MGMDNTMQKSKTAMTVRRTERLAEGVYSLLLQDPQGGFPKRVRPGQFVGVYPKDASALLPRPISVCDFDAERGELLLVYRVAGKGTREFSALQAGDSVDVLGMLGNGYDVGALTGKRVLLLGGGIGAPPMLGLARALYRANQAAGIENPGSMVTAVMGYRSSDLFLTEEFRAVCHLLIATDDGTVGFHGNAVEAARTAASSCDAICACGPLPMLRSVKALAQEKQVMCRISLEERMACGVGACLGCVVKTAGIDRHSHVNNARICTEGPVFAAEDVEI